MGRNKRQETGTVRIRLPDKEILKQLAKSENISVVEYLSRVTRRRR